MSVGCFEEVLIVYDHYIIFFYLFISYSEVISNARKVSNGICAIRQYIFKAEAFCLCHTKLTSTSFTSFLDSASSQPRFPFCVGSACSSRTVHRRLRRNKSSNRTAYIRRGSQRICSKIDIKGGFRLPHISTKSGARRFDVVCPRLSDSSGKIAVHKAEEQATSCDL